MTTVLIDADNVAFACAASAEDASVGIACARAQDMVENIIRATGADGYELWFSGPDNFRYNVYPEYKGNRKDAYRPQYEKAVKDFLTEEWRGNWTEGIEADDMLGIRLSSEDDLIVAHLDKDINQVPGRHFNWELTRLGKVIREERIYEVTKEEGDRFFWYQLIVGDTTDNIKGVVGAGPKKAESILSTFSTNQERFDAINDLYSCEEELDMNAQCLYIWRKPQDNWRNILEAK